MCNFFIFSLPFHLGPETVPGLSWQRARSPIPQMFPCSRSKASQSFRPLEVQDTYSLCTPGHGAGGVSSSGPITGQETEA